MFVNPGAMDITTYFSMRLTASGLEATALTPTNFDLQYVRSGAAPSVKADASALAATDSAHTDNAVIEIDATDAPGLYRVDWPDAAFAAGVREVILSVKVATAFTEHLRVELAPPVNVELWNATAVPAEHAAGYPIVTIKDGAGTGEINTNAGKVVGVELVDVLTTYTGNTPQTGDVFPLASTEIADIKAKTDNLPTDPADQSLIIAATDAIVAAIGALNNLSQANIRTAVGLASADLDTQLTALPTNAELATALGTADDATLAAIAALNNLSSAQVATAVKGIVVESQGSYTLGQVLSILLSALAGVTSSSGAILKTPDGVTTRITATINVSNERTAMVLVPSA